MTHFAGIAEEAEKLLHESPPTEETKELTGRDLLKQALTEKKSLATISEFFRISLDDNFRESPPVIEFNQVGIGGFGEFTLLIGKAKAGKTFVLSLLMAEATKPGTFERIKCHLPEGKNKVLWFDTEQSEADLHRVLKRVSSLTKSVQNLPNPYHLRSMANNVKQQFISDVIKATPEAGLVIIDGIRDLITDINDPKQATAIQEWLLDLTATFNIHLVCVLHQNKGDGNARGHVGTELVNKANSVISVEKKNGCNVVSPDYMRGKDFQPFAFRINEFGLPELIEHETTSTKPDDPANYTFEALEDMVKEVFKIKADLRYAEAWNGVKEYLSKHYIKVGDNKAKAFIPYMVENGLLIKTNTKYQPAKPV